MQRRKFIAGLGSLAAGGAAAMGTGAFTSVQADRTMSITTAADGGAQLALQTGNATNSSYADTSSGEVQISADALNVDASTQINDIFKVRNQGTQPVVVYVDPASIPNDIRTTSSGFGVDPQASNRPNGDYTNSASSIADGVADDQISLTGLYNDPPYEYSAYGGGDDSREEFVLEAGEEFDFGLYVNSNSNSSFSRSIEMKLVADATVVPDTYYGDDT